MKREMNRLASAVRGGRAEGGPGLSWPADQTHDGRYHLPSREVDWTHPEMERRMRARHVWEFLDEGKSTFYARMKPNGPGYDPLFPQPHPMSSTGKGPKRWKLGEVIAWLHTCQEAANNS